MLASSSRSSPYLELNLSSIPLSLTHLCLHPTHLLSKAFFFFCTVTTAAVSCRWLPCSFIVMNFLCLRRRGHLTCFQSGTSVSIPGKHVAVNYRGEFSRLDEKIQKGNPALAHTLLRSVCIAAFNYCSVQISRTCDISAGLSDSSFLRPSRLRQGADIQAERKKIHLSDPDRIGETVAREAVRASAKFSIIDHKDVRSRSKIYQRATVGPLSKKVSALCLASILFHS